MSSSRVIKAATIAADRTAATAGQVEELDRLIAEARAEGFAAGRQDALSLAHAAQRDQLGEALTTWAGQAEADRVASLRADRTEIIDLALEVAQWIVGRSFGEPGALRATIERLMDDVEDEPLRIRLSPETIDLIDETIDGVTIHPDDGLAPGEIVVDTTGPSLQLMFGVALERARSSLMATREAS